MRYRRNPVEYPISRLPLDVSEQDAVNAAYKREIEWVYKKLYQGASVLLECDKQLVPYIYSALRSISQENQSSGGPTFHTGGRANRFKYISGKSNRGQSGEEGEVEEQSRTLLEKYVKEIKDAINMSPETVIIIPHLDLLASQQGGLTDVAKEVIATLYENPDITILGFKDPEFKLPVSLSRLFTAKITVSGIHREALPQLMTQREARKLGFETFDPFALYKYVSGINAVRFRECIELVLTEDSLDFDGSAQAIKKIYREIRELTSEELEIPHIDLFKDIGGYQDIKQQIDDNILALLRQRDRASSVEEVRSIEDLIPRGIIFEGPPGTGKTLFAKGIASAINATVIVVSGPELKSKWVGESEQNLRQIFARARASAPSIIIFDELDSFATKRGENTSGGSGVEHSMINQMLTEMDGFRKDELVFVVGTTNFAKSLDDALLRPGRFEYIINVPYPNDRDRDAILNIYNKKFNLNLSPELLLYLVKKTSGYVDATRGTRFSGDHLQSLTRELKRLLIHKASKSEEPVITKTDIDNLKLLKGTIDKGGVETPKVDLWKDIGGYTHVKELLQGELIDPIQEYKEKLNDPRATKAQLDELQSLIPKGVLMAGPPGVGKTFFAKALATSIGARTIIVSGPELISKWVGASEEKIRQIFSEARRDAPTIIVFDEFDSIASQRSSTTDDAGGGAHARNSVVNQLLTEMDGFRKDELILVIGTTNQIGNIDDAFKRPGRFEYVLNVPYPSAEDRREIFNVYNKKLNLDLAKEQIEYLVKRTAGYFDHDAGIKYSGDHLDGICRELKRIQRKKEKARKDSAITKEDIDSIKLIKTEFEEPLPTKEDEEAIAIHECGHTLVSALLKDAQKPHKVTIAGGEHEISPFNTQFEAREGIRLTRSQIVSQIAVSLSGKMAEELFTGQSSTGVYDDLMNASELARKMVELFGMGSFRESLYQKTPRGMVRRTISAEREKLIDREVETILGEAQDVVRQILVINRDLLEKMIEQLLIKKTLMWEDIQKIITRAQKRMRRYN